MSRELMKIMLQKMLQLMLLSIYWILKIASTMVKLINMLVLFYEFVNQIDHEKLKV